MSEFRMDLQKVHFLRKKTIKVGRHPIHGEELGFYCNEFCKERHDVYACLQLSFLQAYMKIQIFYGEMFG